MHFTVLHCSTLFVSVCQYFMTETRLRLVNDWLFSISNLDSHIVICEYWVPRAAGTGAAACIGNESVATGGLGLWDYWQLADAANTHNCSRVTSQDGRIWKSESF